MHGTLARKQEWTDEDLELIEELAAAEARESFLAFRKYMHPELIEGWWVRETARHLQQFWEDFRAHKRPKLVMEAPPQHGKSMSVEDFIAWTGGKDPDLRSIYASYSWTLGERTNRAAQRLIDTPKYRRIFPGTLLSEAGTRSGNLVAARNTSRFEYVGRKGSFRNTTVEGQITGQGLDLGFVDDPMKGRKEASSKVKRDSTWNWLTDDFFSRFSEFAALLMIMTRWHVDDPVGRWIDRFPDTKVLRYPAIAEKDDRFRKRGEPLFPEHKSLDFLLERKKVLTSGGWESLYQQNPIVVGGGLFPIDEFKFISKDFDRREIRSSVRYWDKAGTEGGGAFTAGVLMHQMRDKTFIVEDVRHGQWSALTRERRILATAQMDEANKCRPDIWVEQEPGSGGKESAENTIRQLAGFTVRADRVTGSKEVRAEPYAAQVQGGNVFLVKGEWNRDFVDEHEQFPNGKYKDQVDAAGGAFNKLVGGSTYDSSLSWVG